MEKNTTEQPVTPTPTPIMIAIPIPITTASILLIQLLITKIVHKKKKGNGKNKLQIAIKNRVGVQKPGWKYGQQILKTFDNPYTRNEIIQRGKELFPILYSCYKDSYSERDHERFFTRISLPPNMKRHGIIFKNGLYSLAYMDNNNTTTNTNTNTNTNTTTTTNNNNNKSTTKNTNKKLTKNGHKSHFDVSTCELTIKHGIDIVCFPANGTHIYQPLDCGIFCSLNNHIKRQDIPKSFTHFVTNARDGMQVAFTFKIIISAFKHIGIYPLNPEKTGFSLKINNKSSVSTPSKRIHLGGTLLTQPEIIEKLKQRGGILLRKLENGFNSYKTRKKSLHFLKMTI
ncbi:spore coat protein sp96 [Anaeramoeba flamelloides]|uniref:Spore coat protein sp96 n=1 Tax=Anaeramoeba flamelloides TaxID=1746091 RepID=A0AAV8A8S9_9EUKA|nr:spore coat protein sp96 [Anaeramoeba flamelloides]